VSHQLLQPHQGCLICQQLLLLLLPLRVPPLLVMRMQQSNQPGQQLCHL
jgi:hypothetical protein